MTARIDQVGPCIPNRNWRWNEVCHLFSDIGDLDELHEFAQSIGLRRSWFQNHPRLPHYDVTRNKRIQAVEDGAVPATRQEMVACMRKL